MRIGMMLLGMVGYFVSYMHGMEWLRGEQASKFVWMWSIIAPLMFGIILQVRALSKPVE